jgi:hypothetical protein
MEGRNSIPHLRQQKEEIQKKKIIPGYKARRWQLRCIIHGSTALEIFLFNMKSSLKPA